MEEVVNLFTKYDLKLVDTWIVLQLAKSDVDRWRKDAKSDGRVKSVYPRQPFSPPLLLQIICEEKVEHLIQGLSGLS